MILSKDAILAADDLKYEDVEVPEWGGSVRVRSLTGSERDEYEASLLVGKGKDKDINFQNARARMIYLSAIDEEGGRLFIKAGDVVAIGKKNANALDRVFSVCQKLSGMRKEDMDELLGNSETAPKGGSTSG